MNQMLHETHPSGVILFLTSDQEAARALEAALAERSIRCESFAEAVAAMTRFADEVPALLLLDTRAVTEPEDLGWLSGRIAAEQHPRPPLVVLSHTKDIRFRLAAMRAGAEAYLLIPQEAEELADRLARLVGARSQAADRVLVVDDQPVAALFAARVLQGAGLMTERVSDPLAVMRALEEFTPDLVLMDLHMPGISGIELTGIIREDDRFADLPIIFLSAELDPEQQMAALRIGGDDFLAKPIGPDQLVDAVRQGLQRARERAQRYQGSGGMDRATGLATRERLLHRLDRLIGQTGSGRSDAKEQVTDRRRTGQRALVYLELSGDEEAMERIAAEVAARVRPDDLAARVGDRAVAVLARRDDSQALAEFAQTLTHQVARALITGHSGAEVGGGWYPLTEGCGDSVTLLSRAGKAARQGLRRGDFEIGHYQPHADQADAAARESTILDAIHAENLRLLYEPIVALTELPGERYEVAPRLLMLDGELLSPADFAPVAARRGVAERLDHWLLTAGLDAMRERLAAGRPAQLFLHQSFAGLVDDDWVGWLRDEINARDLVRVRPILQFQVEEADRNLELAIRRAGQLNRLGIRICLNGIDFSERSTRVLQAIPSTFVRIGRRVVQGPEAGSIAWLIQSAKGCGDKIIATGVDGPEVIARLFRAGVDLIQGPYVQPPTVQMDFDFSVAEISDST